MGDHAGAYAGQSSFFLLMSFIPFVMIILNLVQYTPLTKDQVSTAILAVVPESFHSIVTSIMNQIYVRTYFVLPVSIILALWSACKAVLSLMYGINTIYHVKENRNYFINRFRSMLFTFLIIVGVIVTMILMVFGQYVQAAIIRRFPAAEGVISTIFIYKTPIVMGVMFLIMMFLYKIVPNCNKSVRSQIPGAIVAVLGWQIISKFFSIYIRFFPSATAMYGSLTALVLLMVWLYFCMYSILIGAESNDWIQEKIKPWFVARKERKKAEAETQRKNEP